MRSGAIHPTGHYIAKWGRNGEIVKVKAIKRLPAKDGVVRSLWWKVQLLENTKDMAAGSYAQVSSNAIMEEALGNTPSIQRTTSSGPSNEAPASLTIVPPDMVQVVNDYYPGKKPTPLMQQMKFSVPSTCKITTSLVGDELVIQIVQ